MANLEVLVLLLFGFNCRIFADVASEEELEDYSWSELLEIDPQNLEHFGENDIVKPDVQVSLISLGSLSVTFNGKCINSQRQITTVLGMLLSMKCWKKDMLWPRRNSSSTTIH